MKIGYIGLIQKQIKHPGSLSQMKLQLKTENILLSILQDQFMKKEN